MLCAALLRVSLASELPGAGKLQKSLTFQKPLHPMNRFAHKHGKVEKTDVSQSQADVAESVLRARGSAAMLEKACYQYRQSCRSLPSNEFIGGGAVNWGAEKNRIVTCAELEPDKSNPNKTRKTSHANPDNPTWSSGVSKAIAIFKCPSQVHPLADILTIPMGFGEGRL